MTLGWNKKIPSWEFNKQVVKGFEDWETPSSECGIPMPKSILLDITDGTDRSSKDIAIEVDDWCGGMFYYRDFTNDGLPFVDNGEVYRTRFYFQRGADAVEFHTRYGGSLI